MFCQELNFVIAFAIVNENEGTSFLEKNPERLEKEFERTIYFHPKSSCWVNGVLEFCISIHKWNRIPYFTFYTKMVLTSKL